MDASPAHSVTTAAATLPLVWEASPWEHLDWTCPLWPMLFRQSGKSPQRRAACNTSPDQALARRELLDPLLPDQCLAMM